MQSVILVLGVVFVKKEKYELQITTGVILLERRYALLPAHLGIVAFRKNVRLFQAAMQEERGHYVASVKKVLWKIWSLQTCLLPESCLHAWYWLVVMIIGFLYVIVFTYLDEVTKTLKTLLIPRFVSEYIKTPTKILKIFKQIFYSFKSKFSNKLNHSSQIELMTYDIFVHETDNEDLFERMQYDYVLVSTEEMQSMLVTQKDDEENVFSGLLKIIIFFYQTSVLFRIYTGSRSDGFFYVLQEIMSFLFNLHTN